MDISLFLESPSPRMWTALCPRSISKEALPFSPMIFLLTMDKRKANDAKARSSISHFSQKMYNIDTDF